MWRNLILLSVCIALGAGITYWLDFSNSRGQAPMAEPIPKQAAKSAAKVPDFDFTTLDGQVKSISGLQGKTVVLNFWASWCAPCVKEFPYFLRLAEEFPDDVVFVGLSSDHDMSAMNRFLSKMSYAHPKQMEGRNILIALDEGGKITRDQFQTYRLPETIIIDPKGRMKTKFIGADWAYEDLVQSIQ